MRNIHKIGENIYITNDEEIKDVDWAYHSNQKNVIKIYGSESKLMKGHVYLKKIILTTAQNLIKDGIQPIDNDFLGWFLKNPSCEFIEKVNTSADYEGKFRYYDFKFPKEKHYMSCCISKEECYCEKQETIEDAAEKYTDFWLQNKGLLIKDIFMAGAKWQQERSYSE